MHKEENYLLINENIVKHLLFHKTIGIQFVSRIISHLLGYDEMIVLKNISIIDMNYFISDYSVDYFFNNYLKSNVLLIDLQVSYTSSNTFISCLYRLPMDALGFSKKKKKVVQVFFDDYDRFKRNKFIYNVGCMEKNEHVTSSKCFEKYYFNLSYLRNILNSLILYEKNNLIRTLYFMVYYNKGIFNKLYGNDKLMQKIIREIKKYALQNNDNLYYIDNSSLKYVYEEFFINKTIQLGIIEEKKRITKSLYDNGATLDLIRRATELTIEDVKAIIES